MNYIKKIKSIGFKRIPNIVVLDYNLGSGIKRIIPGMYIETEVNFMKNKESLKYIKFIPNNIMINKYQSYQYKISDIISLYLIIVKEEYTLVINDKSEPDINKYGITIKNNVYVPIHSSKLDSNFWKKIISVLNKKNTKRNYNKTINEVIISLNM